MTKIKIPASAMGTPLTEEELKSIVGGMTGDTNNCSCHLEYELGTSIIGVHATDKETCKAKCSTMCVNDEYCIHADYEYYATSL